MARPRTPAASFVEYPECVLRRVQSAVKVPQRARLCHVLLSPAQRYVASVPSVPSAPVRCCFARHASVAGTRWPPSRATSTRMRTRRDCGSDCKARPARLHDSMIACPLHGMPCLRQRDCMCRTVPTRHAVPLRRDGMSRFFDTLPCDASSDMLSYACSALRCNKVRARTAMGGGSSGQRVAEPQAETQCGNLSGPGTGHWHGHLRLEFAQPVHGQRHCDSRPGAST